MAVKSSSSLYHMYNNVYMVLFVFCTVTCRIPVSALLYDQYAVIQNWWITKGLLISSQNVNKLYILKINKQKTDINYINYINHRNIYNNLKSLTKRQYFSEQLNLYKPDITKIWEILNQIICRKKDKQSLLKIHW